MSLDYYPQEMEWESDDWVGAFDALDVDVEFRPEHPVDIVTLAAAILIMIGLLSGIRHILGDFNKNAVVPANPPIETSLPGRQKTQPNLSPSIAPVSIAAPYDQYILTQGIHGASYGHMAIDIAAGKGEVIGSPIVGTVTAYFFDAIGNPTLVIENSQYRVTMLHGKYTVNVGDKLNLGDPVGTESNLGNTRDMQGRSCRNRDCGYHTHLNIFDKEANTNINPLDVIGN
jgi:murein DD-endopeptidase MepM/ murein hydrolase activator NlpD